jgi:uncharacterized protein (TIGR03435 family)
MTGRAASRLQISVLLLCAAIIAALPSTHADAQAVAPAPSVQETSTPSPAFEVAAIKPNKSGSSSSHSNIHDGRVSATNVTVKRILQCQAYDVAGEQIEGRPARLGTDHFDIEAKMDDATREKMNKLSRDDRSQYYHRLFQQLLADRFKLVVHWETKQLPVYALVIAKNGPRLEHAKNGDGGTGTSSSDGKLTAKGITMDKLAQTLTGLLSVELDRMVVNQTGIAGAYDLALAWSPANQSAAIADASTDNAVPAGPSIFTALQEQLGLKLISAKAPVQALVVDHIEQPSEN